MFVFGPDQTIWELDKSSATAADVLGRSYMKRFYEGALPHGRSKRSGDEGGGADAGATAWVNGQEVRDNLYVHQYMFYFIQKPHCFRKYAV